MKRVIIIYILVIFISVIHFSATENTSDGINSLSNNTTDYCSSRKCIHKCCPFGQYVNASLCEDYHEVLDFSRLSVYNKYMYETGKSVQEVFKILPGKFEDDENFSVDAIVFSVFGYTPYLTEDGVLQLELPNTYDRFTPVQTKDFCVDYLIKDGILTANPLFWAVLEEEEENSTTNKNVFICATLVSCVFLLLLLVVYFLLPELQNLCGLILMAYVASLFMAFLLLAYIQVASINEFVCEGLTLGIYFFFLASFCWMSVMSYDIWWTFRGYAKVRQIHRRGERFKFHMYCLYAWGLPLLMTAGLATLNHIDMKHWPWFVTPNVPRLGCFLEGGSKLVYLYIPMLILIACNWMFYLMTAFNLWRLNRGTAVLDSAAGTPAAHRTQRRRLMVYLKLSVVMGLSWFLEIVSFVYPGFKMWDIFDGYNALIGFVIFLIFVWKKKIYRMLYKQYIIKRKEQFQPGSSRSYSSSSLASKSETIGLQACSNPNGDNVYSDSMINIKTV